MRADDLSGSTPPPLALCPGLQHQAQQARVHAILAALAVTGQGGWLNEQQQPSTYASPPRLAAAAAAAGAAAGGGAALSPRSALPSMIAEQPEAAAAAGASGRETSLSSSSHGSSLAELGGPPEAELSELEQRKVVVLG